MKYNNVNIFVLDWGSEEKYIVNYISVMQLA